MDAVLADVARRARAAGLCVLPVVKGEKRPAVRWTDYQKVPPSDDEFEHWLLSDRVDRIGVVCGEVSGYLMCLDVEGRAVELWGSEIVPAIVEAKLDVLFLDNYVETTPSGGLHFLVRVAGCLDGNVKLASSGDGETLVEVRGEGGFSVIAPSEGGWKAVAGNIGQIPTIRLNDWRKLLDVIREFDEMPKPPGLTLPTTPQGIAEGFRPYDLSWTTQTGRPGDRFNREHTWPEILEPTGAKQLRTVGELTEWNRPGAKTNGVDGTTNYKGSDLLYVHSTSWHPFEANRSYDKFGAWTLLKHHGDFSAAARELKPDEPARPVDDLLVTPSSTDDAVTTDDIRPPLLVPHTEVSREQKPWLVEACFRRREIAWIVADPGAGKSTALVGLGCSLTTGVPWAGLRICEEPCGVLYVATEDRAGVLARIDSWQEFHGREVGERFYVLNDGASFLSTDVVAMDDLEDAIRSVKPSAVMFDTLAMSLGLRDENDASEVTRSIRPIVDLIARTKVLGIFAHHESKTGGYRGSTALIAAIRAELKIRSTGSGLVLEGGKMNNGQPLPRRGVQIVSAPSGGPVFVQRHHADESSAVAELIGRLDEAGAPLYGTREMREWWSKNEGTPLAKQSILNAACVQRMKQMATNETGNKPVTRLLGNEGYQQALDDKTPDQEAF